MANWLYKIGDDEHGPVSPSKIKELAATGELKPDHLVRREDMSKWAPASQVKGLFESQTPDQDATSVKVLQKEQNSKDVISGVPKDGLAANNTSIRDRIAEAATGFADRVTKQAQLQSLMWELSRADEETGNQAYIYALDPEFEDLYQAIRNVDQQIALKREPDSLLTEESMTEKAKKVVKDAKNKLDIELLLSQRKKCIRQLGEKLRVSGIESKSNVIRDAILKASAINNKVEEIRVATTEGSSHSSKQNRILQIVAFVTLSLFGYVGYRYLFASKPTNKALASVISSDAGQSLEASMFFQDKRSAELKVVADLKRQLENRNNSLKAVSKEWEGDEEIKAVRKITNLAAASTFCEEKSKNIKAELGRVIDVGAVQLKQATESVKNKFRTANDTAGLSKIEKDISLIREEFQKHLDTELLAFKSETKSARDSVLENVERLKAEALAQQINDEMLEKIKQLKTKAESSTVKYDSKIPLHPASWFTQKYLRLLLQAGAIKELPQVDLIRVIDALIKSSDDELVSAGLAILGRIDDVSVFEQLAEKDVLQTVECRKILADRLPTLIVSSGITPNRGRKLIAKLADSYLADPQPGHEVVLDQAIRGVQSDELRQSAEFVWFMAAASLSGSKEAEKDLFTIFTSDSKPPHDLYYLHIAARRNMFNRVVGEIISKRAGNNSVKVFHQCIGTIVGWANRKNINIVRIPDLGDFLDGWFVNADANFAPEALRIYKLIFKDPQGQKLSGNEKILGRFGGFRLGTLSLLLRLNDGQSVGFLYQLNKLYWQFERVIALQTIRRLGRLEKIEPAVLIALVDDPWQGTASYPEDLVFGGSFQRVRINEWIMYADALEERSVEDAVDAYLRAVKGQTAIRKSLEGESQMFPYRIYALRRLLSLRPEAFNKLMKYVETEECPGTVRLAILCIYAAEHRRIGDDSINQIPTKMANDRLGPTTNSYVSGMLNGFEAVRTGTEPSGVKSLDTREVQGYADVLFSYDRPALTQLAFSALKYKSVPAKPQTADVRVASYNSEITPFHFMEPDLLVAVLQRIAPDSAPLLLVKKYEDWAASVWPSEVETAIQDNPKRVRPESLGSKRATNSGQTKGSGSDDLRAFDAEPTVALAVKIVSNWLWYDKQVIQRAFRAAASDPKAVETLGSMILSISRSPEIEGTATGSIVLQRRAEVLESVFTDLQKFEINCTDLEKRRKFRNHVVKPLKDILEEGSKALQR